MSTATLSVKSRRSSKSRSRRKASGREGQGKGEGGSGGGGEGEGGRMGTLYHHSPEPFGGDLEAGGQVAFADGSGGGGEGGGGGRGSRVSFGEGLANGSDTSLSSLEAGASSGAGSPNLDEDSASEDEDEMPNPNTSHSSPKHQITDLLTSIQALTPRLVQGLSRPGRENLEMGDLERIRNKGMFMLDRDINRRDESGQLKFPPRKRGGMAGKTPVELAQHANKEQKSDIVEAALKASGQGGAHVDADAETPSTRSPFWGVQSGERSGGRLSRGTHRADNHPRVRPKRADTFAKEGEESAVFRCLWFGWHVLYVLGKMAWDMLVDMGKMLKAIATVLNDLSFGIKTEPSSTAFVTFRSHVATASAIQVRLSRDAFSMVATAAPEVRDVLYANVAVPSRRIFYRKYFIGFWLAVLCIWWAVVVSALSSLPSMLEVFFDEEFAQTAEYVGGEAHNRPAGSYA